MAETGSGSPVPPGIFCSLVIPCYNEEGNLARLVSGFSAALSSGDFELIVVDNGSVDSSASILRALAPGFPLLRVVTVPENRGYGYGISQGLKAARGLYAGWAHGDMQYDPAEVLAAAEKLRAARGGKIFLKGLRSARSPVKMFFTAGMAAFASLLFGGAFRDINGQPTIFHRSLLDHWAGAPSDFSLDLYAYALAKKLGFTVLRVPMSLRERASGVSSWNSGLAACFGLAWRTIKSSLAVRRGLGRIRPSVRS
jgi:glycosyltransferase involved in cell wall biosynthesis